MSDPSTPHSAADGPSPPGAATGAAPGAAVGAALVGPLVIALVVPALLLAIDRWRRDLEGPSLAIGTVMGLAGTAMVVRAGLDRTRAGVDHDRPCSTGLFAHCRNPIPLGILAVLAGVAMASRSPLVGIYLLSTAVALHLWIVARDEPRLARTAPTEWSAYRRSVPRWFPRLLARGAA